MRAGALLHNQPCSSPPLSSLLRCATARIVSQAVQQGTGQSSAASVAPPFYSFPQHARYTPMLPVRSLPALGGWFELVALLLKSTGGAHPK